MRFVVVGAGAIGGTLGAHLQRAGHEITFVARGEHGRVMATEGLTVRSPDDEFRVEAMVAARPEDAPIAEADAVLVAVKSQDTVDVLDAIAAAAGDVDVPVVCVQNGVSNEREALRRFENVYGCLVMCPAMHLRPGEVAPSSAPVTGMLDLGRYPSGVDENAVRIAAAIDGTGFESIPQPDIMSWKHRKLLMNLSNAVDALCGPSARGGELGRLAYEEGKAVLTAAGVSWTSTDTFRERRSDHISIRPVPGYDGRGSSTWQSLTRGSGIETDHLNGEITLLGRLHGVPTPVNALLQRAMREAGAAGRAAGSVAESYLLARLG